MVDQTYKNIVIIGASAAGHNLANELFPSLPDGYRILLIDALDFAFFPLASLRAAVVPGWEEKIVLPLRTSTVFPSGSFHQVIAPNRVVELKKNSVILEKPFEGSTEVSFYKAVIATGASQPSPMRPSGEWTKEEYMTNLRKSQEEIKDCESLVIVGGGTVGVELAGEVRASYPDKKITLVHNRSTLLNPPSPSDKKSQPESKSYISPPTPLKLCTSLTTLVEGQDVNLILEDKVVIPSSGSTNAKSDEWDGSFGLQSSLKTIHTEKGEVIKGDYIFLSVGNKPNSALVSKVDVSAVEEKSGLIKVDEYLKIESSVLGEGKYYAIGDAANAPGLKTIWLASVQAKALAANLINELNDRPLAPYTPGTFSGLFVPFGPELGAASITLPYLGTWTVGSTLVSMAKGRKLLLDKWAGSWKGEEKVEILV